MATEDKLLNGTGLSHLIAKIKTLLSLKVNSSDLAPVATSGKYSDLTDLPTIPATVTESTVSGWGFTKNTGTYNKPSGGIPASDLASGIIPSALKNPNALTITIGDTTITYDGSSTKNITVPVYDGSIS